MAEINVLPQISKSDLNIEPIERAETIPSKWYISPEIHEFERQTIFAGTWQYVGHVSQAKLPGDYLLATVADNPLIIVRDHEQQLRAFYNVCRHRGGPLATENGHCKVLQCQYHGWTYLLDGSLRGVPEFDRVELFDKKDYGLVPVELDVWQDLVFVTLTPPSEPLAHLFEGIVDRIAPLSLQNKKFAKRVIYDIDCNWKVYIDNYLEGYHLPYVHPELCTLLDYYQYVTETCGHYSLQYSPFKEGDNLYKADDGRAFYYLVFPNLTLNILPGRLQTNIILPTGPEQCRVIFDYFYDDITSAAAKHIMAEDEAYSNKVQQEDIDICEHVQKGLRSRAYDRGRFSVKCEQGVYHFQRLLKAKYGEGLEALT